jgi:FkbM family methyltransferase
MVARRCFPAARIFAFEPLPRPAAKFAAVFAHDAGVTLHRLAIAPEAGTASIHISRHEDSSSLLPITSKQVQAFPGTGAIGISEVQTAPLHHCISPDQLTRPALLKLDVQGYELEALKGCREIFPSLSYIYVECSFLELYSGQALADEVVSWLTNYGFELRGLHNAVFDSGGRAIQADFLFEPRSA